MIDKVLHTIDKYGLIQKGERIIVGFSAGVDSVCLLHLLSQLTQYRLELIALYVNHSLRPAENQQEVALLAKMGRWLGIATQEVRLDLPRRLAAKPQSLQLLAREERYRIFREVMAERGAAKVALAHHRDDQAETILYRIIRGTGLDGLAGIPVCREGVFIRPLREISRAEILQYMTRFKLDWVEDSSNKKDVYRRNRIRHQLLPRLETDFNPRVKEALVRLGELAEEQRDFMEQLIEEYRIKVLIIEERRVGVALDAFCKLHHYLQYNILKKALLQLDSKIHLETGALQRMIAKIVGENNRFKRIDIFKGIVAYFQNGAVYFEKERQETDALSVGPHSLHAPGISHLGPLGLKITIALSRPPAEWSTVAANEVFIRALDLPPLIRFWQPGDAFKPLGMGGTQKLHDFFINAKVDRKLRRKIPLLATAEGQIVWVIGYRLSEEFKVTSNTKKVWRITVEPSDGD